VPAPVEHVATASGPALSARALVIGIDGLRPDALAAARTPHLDTLFATGRFTHRGTTQLDGATSSAPGWASVLTGVDADEHGVHQNGDEAGVRRAQHPTFLARAVNAGGQVFVATEDPAVTVMLEPAIAEAAFEGDGARVAAAATARLSDAAVEVAFVVFEGVDDAGHGTGFSASNPAYLAAVERIDSHVGAMLTALRARPGFSDERWLIVVVADHSGVGHGHGPRTREYQTIPLAYSSPLLAASELDEAHRSHVQIAGAVLSWVQGQWTDVLGPVATQ
jgi:predicted AlkP superfamily pyrophosphatase or phosphodiesterase